MAESLIFQQLLHPTPEAAYLLSFSGDMSESYTRAMFHHVVTHPTMEQVPMFFPCSACNGTRRIADVVCPECDPLSTRSNYAHGGIGRTPGVGE